MMMELKMARESVNHKHDNIVDLCRYAALRDRMTDEQADTKDYTPIAPPKEDKPKCLGHPMKVNAHTDCSTCHVKLACIHTAASQKRRMDAINRPEL